MRFYLTEKQSNIIKEALNDKKRLLKEDASPIRSLDDLLLSKLKAERLRDVTSCFSDDISSISRDEVKNKLSRLMNVCRKKEANIRPQLEKICYNTLVEIFDIPEDSVFYECHLVDNIDPSKEFHMFPDTNEEEEYEDYNEIDNENAEVEKRKIIQAMFIGASNNIYERVRKIFIDDVFDLDETLPHLYSKIIKLNNFLLATSNVKNTDKNHNQGGYVEVKLGDDEKQTEITVTATIFPILLIESIRGFMELFASNGLPDSLQMAKKVINKSDALEDEPWYMKFGPVLWKRFTDALGEIDTKDIPDLFTEFAQVPAKDFINMSKELFYNTRRGKEIMNNLRSYVIHNKEYSRFEDDLMKKQSERGLIEDEYYADEEFC